MWRRKEERQRDLAHCLEADCIAAVEQQCCKNWLKTFLHPSNPPSNKGMNLIDLPPLTKRQRVWYLPKKTLEACQWHEELAREMGVAAVGGGNPCERYMDFRILCIPQNLPWVFFCSISLLLANFYSHATSCAPCAKAKAACKPFDVDKAHVKARYHKRSLTCFVMNWI